MKLKTILMAIVMAFSVSSCTAINEFGDQVHRVLKKNKKEQPVTRTVEVEATRIQQELLRVDSWSLIPEKPISGERVKSEIQLTAFSKNSKNPVELKISRSLIMGDETIQFGKPKIESRAEGVITLNWKFTLPVDADAGEYVLVTNIESGERSEEVKNSFFVH